MSTLLKIYFKSYKKEVFLFCINILKNKRNTKKPYIYRRSDSTQSKQLYLSEKKKVHKYTILRATHEFKYSWEKYIEYIHNSEYQITLKKYIWNNQIIGTISNILKIRNMIGNLKSVIYKNTLLTQFAILSIQKLYRCKHNLDKYSVFDYYLFLHGLSE